MFKDLITHLKTVKTEHDLTSELTDELFNAGIVSAIHLVLQEQPTSTTSDAIEVARMTMLKHFDILLMDAILNEVEQEED